MDKQTVVHPHKGVLFHDKKQWQVVILQHLTTLMDRDCEGVCRGEPSKHNVLHVIVD